MSTARKILLAILLVSLTGTAFGAGTFASFTASTTNSGSTFASGNLVLNDSPGVGTGGGSASACTSAATGGGGVTQSNSNSSGCGVLFNLSVQKPGDSAYAYVDISNVGNINASYLYMYLNAASQAGACTDANTVTGPDYHGSGSLCSILQVKIEETDSAHTTVRACRFPAYATTTCASSGTLSGTTPLNAYWGQPSSVGAQPATALDLGTYNTGTSTATQNGNQAGTPAVSGSQANTRYFKVTLTFPSSADNSYQGRSASFALTFTAAQ